MTPKNDFDYFIQLIQALEPWLSRIVIVGGWAHRLYRFHELAQPIDYRPLLTFDMDVAVPTDLPVEQEDIAQRLANEGFTQRLLGDRQPPFTRYELGVEDQGFYAEFLTPMYGSGYRRDGQPDQTVNIAGVSSQKVRYLDVLLQAPWPVVLRPSPEVRITKPTLLYVPNPTAFILQKLLIQDKRDRAHRAKDLLYIHDTIELFGANLEKLHTQWNDTVLPNLHPNHAAKVRAAATALISELSNTHRDASAIARAAGRVIRSEELQEVCSAGLEIILHNDNPASSAIDEFLPRDQDGAIHKTDPEVHTPRAT